ncbi:MAG: tetratricopeptide repeat protein [Bacteroidaceae bacterium]|nr:tetratricopeptide repeat protein [Bacteroidaceae bacterium]
MKKIILSLAAIMTAAIGFAQDGQIYKAQEQINEGKFMEARETMKGVLENPKTKKLAYAYNVAGQVELRLLSAEADKHNAHEALDTALFISSMDNAVKYFTKSYELDHQPDAKGKVKPRFDYGTKKNEYDIGEHNGNVEWMKKIVNNYILCAQYCLQNGDKKGAYDFYEKHLNFPKNPVFTAQERDSLYTAGKDIYEKVGYFATQIAFTEKQYDRVLESVDFVIQSNDRVTKEDGYYMKATSLQHKGDTAQWLATLKGAMENTTNVTYPQILLKYYYDKHQQDEAMKIANEFVAKAPGNKMAHYIKGVVLMDQGKDSEALACYEKALELDPNFVEAVANVGVVHFNEIRDLNQKATTNNRDPQYKAQQTELKEKLTTTRTFFAKVQELAPERSDLWQSKLDNIDELISVVNNNLSEVAKRDKK